MTSEPSPESSEGQQAKVAVVLSGAGARGAYEAGALSVLLPILKKNGETIRIVVGTSVGALNAALLANVVNESDAAELLVQRWCELKTKDVIHTPRKSVWLGLKGAVRRRFAGPKAPWRPTGLLSTAPLESTIARLVGDTPFTTAMGAPFESVCIVASSSTTARAVAFVETTAPHLIPGRPSSGNIDYVDTTLTKDHLMASSAFPMVFAPRRIGPPPDAAWYIDGGVHLNTGLKPAIDLGAERLLILGATPTSMGELKEGDPPPNWVDANGQILHALLMDEFEADLSRLQATNRYVALNPATDYAPGRRHRAIEYFAVSPPTETLSDVAADVWKPGFGRLFTSFAGYSWLGPLTRQRQYPGQFLSYMCFHPKFICKALTQGKADAEVATNGGTTIPWKYWS